MNLRSTLGWLILATSLVLPRQASADATALVPSDLEAAIQALPERAATRESTSLQAREPARPVGLAPAHGGQQAVARCLSCSSSGSSTRPAK